ncbi:hypothetical protein [Anaerocolumna sp. MB42-C2]|uniref:hypothetical protein n=1 Tax=Anaerocolumna sp. MB42-C2 TaxID=3070997 RepID=UPI0027DEF002|nr:hypothetical protein [Anaerocolumna sp. MB42-C2]WMJ89218.1 hypothetical protein RBU59_06745 [Anaerocolumna sp. MB42-C2]
MKKKLQKLHRNLQKLTKSSSHSVHNQHVQRYLGLLDNRNPLLFILADYNVEVKTSSKIIKIKNDGILINNNGVSEEISADMVITAFGMKVLNELANKIANKYQNASIIGDCNKIGQVAGAVRNGFFAGWAVR